MYVSSYYYICVLIQVPFPILWLRYSGFILLYPIGVAGTPAHADVC
jgi:hypothetical protein